MQRLRCLPQLFVLVMPMVGAEKPKVLLTVRAISHETHVNQSQYTTTTPGTSSTNCSVQSTSVGRNTNGTANCETVTRPATSTVHTRETLDVLNKVEANGRVYTIACRASWVGSNCGPLIDGDTFDAEVKGTTMWLNARRGGNQGKLIRIKYKVLDIR